MENLKLVDGSVLAPLSAEEKASLEKELEALFTKYSATMIPFLITEVGAIKASIGLYKREIPSPLNGEIKEETKENTNATTEESSKGGSGESA